MNLPSQLISRALCYGVLGLLTLMTLSACEQELDPLEPEGAYNVFRNAMLAGDVDAVWARADQSTHESFDAYYEHLGQMRKDIKRYFPVADHTIAQRQTGAVLLSKVDSGKALFSYVFNPKRFSVDEQGKPLEPKVVEAYKLGSDIESISLTEDELGAEIKTRGGQSFILVKNPVDKQWYVKLSSSLESFDKSMSWVDKNQDALKKTIEDLIEEERTKRAAIISELMK